MFRSLVVLIPLLCVLAACATARSTIIPAPLPASTPRPTPTSLPPLHIVTVGDSLTWGDKDDAPGGGWPRRIQSLIAAQRPGSQVVNLAQPGWTSRDLLQGTGGAPNQIDQAVRILREANGEKIATVWIGVNDLFYLYEFGNPTPAEEDREAARFQRDLDELLDRLSRTGAHVYLALLHDLSSGPVQTSGVFMSTAGEEWTRMSGQAERFNAIIKAVAAKYGAALVDIPATKIFTTPSFMFEDGIHPNARGYDELAKVWWNVLQDAVTR